MRFLALALLLAATPAFAGEDLIVQKKVTALETTDKITRTDITMRVPEVLSCFDRVQTVSVEVVSKDGVVTTTSDAKKKSTETCLAKQFATIKLAGSFKATVQLVVKHDPRSKSSVETALAALDPPRKQPQAPFGAGGVGRATNEPSSTVAIGVVTAANLGDHTSAELAKVVTSHSGAYGACFDMRKAPNVTLTYEIQVSETGAVTNVKVKSPAKKLASFAECLTRQIKVLEFEPKGAVTFTVPLTFKSA